MKLFQRTDSERATDTGNGRPGAAVFIYPLLVFVIALILRFLYIYQFRGDLFSDCLILDPKYYSDWAARISSGDWLGVKAFEMTPLYAYLLAIVYKLVSTDLFIVRLFQIVIGSVSCVLIYAMIRELVKGRNYALIGGLMAAAYGPFIFFDGMVMKPFLAVFFLTLMTLFLLRSARKGVYYPFFAGASLALAALVRENVVLLLPVIPLFLLLGLGGAEREDVRRRLLKAAFFIVGFIIVVMPATIRNYHVSGELVMITGGGGSNFYIGNNPESDGTYIHPAFIRPTPEFEHEDFRVEAMRIAGKELSRKEASEFWYDRGWEFIFDNPVNFAGLLTKKFTYFFNFYEFPDNRNYYFQSAHSNILGLPLLHFGIIAPLGLLGMALAIRRRREFSFPYLIFFVYLGSVMIFFNLARYRIPAVSLLIVFSVYAISWLADKAREGRRGALVLAIVALILCFAFVNYNFLGKEPYSYKFDTAYVNLGNCYARARQFDKASLNFGRAVEVEPINLAALVGLGNVSLSTGRLDLAERSYKRAIEIDPNFALGYYGLASVEEKQGKLGEAEKSWTRFLALAKDSPWRARAAVRLERLRAYLRSANGREGNGRDTP